MTEENQFAPNRFACTANPIIAQKNDIVLVEQKKYELEVKQAESLSLLAKGVNDLAAFVTGGGLSQMLRGYAQSQTVSDILGGLAAHDGRNALDARVLGQNAIEIVTQVTAVWDKFQERMAEKESGEPRDPNIVNSENDFQKWVAERSAITEPQRGEVPPGVSTPLAKRLKQEADAAENEKDFQEWRAWNAAEQEKRKAEGIK